MGGEDYFCADGIAWQKFTFIVSVRRSKVGRHARDLLFYEFRPYPPKNRKKGFKQKNGLFEFYKSFFGCFMEYQRYKINTGSK